VFERVVVGFEICIGGYFCVFVGEQDLLRELLDLLGGGSFVGWI